MCCGHGFAKIFLVIINTIFIIIGGTLLGIGVALYLNNTSVLSTFSRIPVAGGTIDEIVMQASYIKNICYMLIAVGMVQFKLGMAGCCGAIREKKSLLKLYAICVFVILLVEIVGTALIFYYHNKFVSYFRVFMNTTITDYYQGTSYEEGITFVESIDAVTASWDYAQTSFECCGAFNYTDFEMYATIWNNTYIIEGTVISARVPVTCCTQTADSVFPGNVKFENLTQCLVNGAEEFINPTNCYDDLTSLLTRYTMTLAGIGIGTIVVEIIAIAFALYLFTTHDNRVKPFKEK